MSEQIHVAGMPLIWAGLCCIRDDAEAVDKYYGNIQHWMEASELAWLVECMKEMPDKPEHFPGGKWASIQLLQEHVAKAARKHVTEAPCPS